MPLSDINNAYICSTFIISKLSIMTDIKAIGRVEFDNQNLKNLMERYALKSLHIMSCNNQSNTSTLRRWLMGGDMQVSALVNVCSGMRLDLLSFFRYDGHKFQTHLENLYRFERAGLSVEECLREHGVECYREVSDHSPQSLAKGAGRTEIDAINDKALASHAQREEQRRRIEGQILSVDDVLDRLAKVQSDAFAHELAALDALRSQHGQETADLHKRIGQLEALLEAEKEKNRQLRSEIGCHTTHRAADDSKPGAI